VKAHPQLGAFVPDFLAARTDSTGVRWTMIELQSPTATLFTRSGRPTKQLDEGLRQIRDWREWLMHNGEYARKPKASRGLGFNGLDHRADGLVIIGRGESRSTLDRQRLVPLAYESRIDIHSYDWLVREAQRRIEGRERREASGESGCVDCDPIAFLTHPRRRTAKSGSTAAPLSSL
jgi:hypothetical protein